MNESHQSMKIKRHLMASNKFTKWN